MLGNIIGIEENLVLVKLADAANANLSNMYVTLENSENICVGEIGDIKDGIAYINLLGEIIDSKFVFGVIRKPLMNSNVKLIPEDKIPAIISCDNRDEARYLYMGKSPIYKNVDINVPINKFFSNHFAKIGRASCRERV